MIYGFRGSDIESFFDFVNKYKLKQFKLERNYRSSQTIVNAAQSVIENNKKQFKKNVFSENPKGTNVVFYNLPDQETEAAQITKIVKAFHRQYNMPYNDMAILYRMNFVSRNIEKIFLQNEIPYRMLSGLPFYERMEIKDIIAYLGFLVNPYDKLALCRILNVPKRNIGEKSIQIIYENYCKDHSDNGIISLEEAIEELNKIVPLLKNKKTQAGLKNFIARIEVLKECMETYSPAEMVDAVATEEYYEYLRSFEEEKLEERKENIAELWKIAKESPDLLSFVSSLAVDNDPYSEDDDDSDKVNMVTVHGAKGLEFKLVILACANDGIIPHLKEIQLGDVTEERRLFYVAMTRAKDFLFLTRPKVMNGKFGERLYQKSRFIREIDSNLLTCL